ncbi:MAG: hypothetical protein R3D98_09935 [Candidatus Krumholzibacteriia bacterium]
MPRSTGSPGRYSKCTSRNSTRPAPAARADPARARLGRAVEDLEQAVGRGHALLDAVVDLAQLLHRAQQAEHGRQEGQEGGGLEGLLHEDLATAVPEDHRAHHHGHLLGQGRRQPVGARDLEHLAEHPVALRQVLALLERFHGERLDDADAVHRLLQDARQVGQAFLLAVAVPPQPLADRHDHEQRQGQHEHRQDGQLPADPEADGQVAQDLRRVTYQVGEAHVHGLGGDLDVVGRAADQLAGAMAVIEAERQLEQAAEDVVAHVGDQAQAEPVGQDGARVLGQVLGQEHQHDQHDHPLQRFEPGPPEQPDLEGVVGGVQPGLDAERVVELRHGVGRRRGPADDRRGDGRRRRLVGVGEQRGERRLHQQDRARGEDGIEERDQHAGDHLRQVGPDPAEHAQIGIQTTRRSVPRDRGQARVDGGLPSGSTNLACHCSRGQGSSAVLATS